MDGTGQDETKHRNKFQRISDRVTDGGGYGCISGLSGACESVFDSINKEQKDELFVEVGPVYGLDVIGAFLRDDSVFRGRRLG